MENEVKGFTFYRSYFESLMDLDDEDRKDILEAMIQYVFSNIEPEFDGFKKTIWTLIKPNLTTSKNRSINGTTKQNQNKNKTKSKVKQNKNNDLFDKDKDKDKEKEIDKENDSIVTTTINICELIESNFGRTISPIEYEKTESWLSLFEKEIVEYAIRLAVLSNKKSFKYIEGILKNWKSAGYNTLQEIKDDEIKREQPQRKEIFDYDWLNEGLDE